MFLSCQTLDWCTKKSRSRQGSLSNDSFVLFFVLLQLNVTLKAKSGVGIIVDYSRDYTVVNSLLYFFQFFSPLICETTYFNLLRSAR